MKKLMFEYFHKSKDFDNGYLKIDLGINNGNYRYILDDFACENYIDSNIKYKIGDVLNYLKNKSIKSEKYDIKEKKWVEI